MIADHFDGIEAFEADLWKLADTLRANSNLASNEYFMPIMGLIFLRHATTRRIFGDYVSRYDFKRSEEDGATIGLTYENRGELLGVAHGDVTDLLKALHRIVNQAIDTQAPGADQAAGMTFDLSQLDLERLRDEFARRVTRKATAIRDIRDIVEQKLAAMLARNPMRMNYQIKYEQIVAAYNQEKDRATVEQTFGELINLIRSLDEEQKRAAREGLQEDELAIFDILQKDGLKKTETERVKQASRELLAALKARLAQLDHFWEKEQTKAEVEVFILDKIYSNLPTPPFSEDEKKLIANNVYAHVWQQAMGGGLASAA